MFQIHYLKNAAYYHPLTLTTDTWISLSEKVIVQGAFLPSYMVKRAVWIGGYLTMEIGITNVKINLLALVILIPVPVYQYFFL